MKNHPSLLLTSSCALPLLYLPRLRPSVNASSTLPLGPVVLTGRDISPLLLDIDSSDLNPPARDTNYL